MSEKEHSDSEFYYPEEQETAEMEKKNWLTLIWTRFRTYILICFLITLFYHMSELSVLMAVEIAHFYCSIGVVKK